MALRPAGRCHQEEHHEHDHGASDRVRETTGEHASKAHLGSSVIGIDAHVDSAEWAQLGRPDRLPVLFMKVRVVAIDQPPAGLRNGRDHYGVIEFAVSGIPVVVHDVTAS